MRVGIVGGGLAGLACGINLRLAGIEVEIFDKQRIPCLKVCGEYLSLEVLPLLEKLGVSLRLEQHPLVDRLTCRQGNHSLERLLPLGGIGISRQCLDGELKDRFLKLGGVLHEQANVRTIDAKTITLAQGDAHYFDTIVNASGRLNPFVKRSNVSGTAYVGYKKHVPAKDWEPNRIHLEFYEWGYLGFNQVEDGFVCVCNLVKQSYFKSLKSIEAFEKGINLSDLNLDAALRYPAKTVTISNFQFYTYSQSDSLTIGDAAGNIPPLVGNGMSLAIQSGSEMGRALIEGRKPHFEGKNSRIKMGLLLNRLSMSPLAGFGIELIDSQKAFAQELISLTHGQPT